ncbi:MAG: HAD family phosphatase [Firmicutes bacterium]|nr:HAD family phosphatase [Bacillota bacterium]
MMKRNMKKAIVFDMGGVLVVWDPGLFVRRLGLSDEDAALLKREVYGNAEWPMMDRGLIDADGFRRLVFPRIPARLHSAAEELAFHWADAKLEIPGMDALLRELKDAGHPLYLLSNASLAHHDYWPMYPIAGLIEPSRVFISADVRLLKPEPAIYEAFLAKYGLDPADCVFIDDFSLNVLFAREAGMDGIVFFGDVPRLRRELRALGIEISGAEDQ